MFVIYAASFTVHKVISLSVHKDRFPAWVAIPTIFIVMVGAVIFVFWLVALLFVT